MGGGGEGASSHVQAKALMYSSWPPAPTLYWNSALVLPLSSGTISEKSAEKCGAKAEVHSTFEPSSIRRTRPFLFPQAWSCQVMEMEMEEPTTRR